MRLTERIRRSIANRNGNVILRSELVALGSPSQLSRALSELMDEGCLIRVGKGIYAKTRTNSFTGQPSPNGTLESIASEAFQKLGIEISSGKMAQDYNNGRSTQIPPRTVVNTGDRRIRRRIEVGGRALVYENDFGRAKSQD